MSWFNKSKPDYKVVKSRLRGTFIPKEKTVLGCYRTMKTPGNKNILFTLPGAETDPYDAEFDTENEAWEQIKEGRLI